MRSFLSSQRRLIRSGSSEAEELRAQTRKVKMPKFKIPGKKKSQQKNIAPGLPPDGGLDVEEVQEKPEQLENISRRLIMREEQLFGQDSHSEEDEDQLHRDLEALWLQIQLAVHNTFTSSAGDLEVLRSAVASIQQQEEQDQRWAGCPEDRVPVWRPQKCLRTHNMLLQKVVQSRLKGAVEELAGETDGLSSALKKEVCRMGKRLKDDLLTVERTVKDCYPPEMDILNIYAGLYQHNFSTRLKDLAGSEVDVKDCSYLLFWTNQYYPNEVLKHKELDGKIKTSCLGPLLPQDDMNHLENQCLTHSESRVKMWLQTALRKEEEMWLSGREPELIDTYYFSPLALDIIQMIDSVLTDLSCVLSDQTKARRITTHLESFLNSYRKALEDFVKGNHGNVSCVIKAQLVCEEQLRDYIANRTGSLSEQQRQRCLDTLSALRDCGYSYLTCAFHSEKKQCCSQLWTPAWLDGSLPVIDRLLDSANQHQRDLKNLKLTCRQRVLSVLYQDLVCYYMKKIMRSRRKSREQQVGGAQRIRDDACKMHEFFTDQGCTDSSWLTQILNNVAEILHLQDPGSVHLEMISLSRSFPDLSEAHVSALLLLKTGLSATDVRSIKASVQENRPLDLSTNQSPAFFSKVKVKSMSNKIVEILKK